MWQKLLQLQFASDARAVLKWMLDQGIGPTLEAYNCDLDEGRRAAAGGAVHLTRWTGGLRQAMQTQPGALSSSSGALRRAAFTDDGGLLFVNAGPGPLPAPGGPVGQLLVERRQRSAAWSRNPTATIAGWCAASPPTIPASRPMILPQRSMAAAVSAARCWPPASCPAARSPISSRPEGHPALGDRPRSASADRGADGPRGPRPGIRLRASQWCRRKAVR